MPLVDDLEALLRDIERDDRMSGVPRYRHHFPDEMRALAHEVWRLRSLAESHGVDPTGCEACFLHVTGAGPPCPDRV